MMAITTPNPLVSTEQTGLIEDRAGSFQVPNWAQLVARIHALDGAAMEELYAVLEKGIRYFLLRNLGADELDDKVHNCFVIVVQAIQNGELREPSRLMGYVWTVAKRQIAASIKNAPNGRRTYADHDNTLYTVSDWRDDPERTLVEMQRADIARRVLNGIPRRDREILERFYLKEQGQEQICKEMALSYTQFRLLKSRAKTRFGELGKRVAFNTRSGSEKGARK